MAVRFGVIGLICCAIAPVVNAAPTLTVPDLDWAYETQGPSAVTSMVWTPEGLVLGDPTADADLLLLDSQGVLSVAVASVGRGTEIAVAADGGLYVFESAASDLLYVAPNGDVSVLSTSGRNGAMTVDSEGDLYVISSGGIYRFDEQTGQYVYAYNPSVSTSSAALAAIPGSGDGLFYGMTGGSNAQLYRRNTGSVSLLGAQTGGTATDLVVDPLGRPVYAVRTSSGQATVFRRELNNDTTTLATFPDGAVAKLAVSDDGTVFVDVASENAIYSVADSGLELVYSYPGAADAIAMSTGGALHTLDAFGTVYAVDNAGGFSTVAEDLTFPTGLALDADGFAYTVESTGSAVRIGADGSTTGVWGGVERIRGLTSDSTGQVFGFASSGNVYELGQSTGVLFASIPGGGECGPAGISMDLDDRVVLTTGEGCSESIYRERADAASLPTGSRMEVVSPGFPIGGFAYQSSAVAGNGDIFAKNFNGELLRRTTAGVVEVVGSGFGQARGGMVRDPLTGDLLISAGGSIIRVSSGSLAADLDADAVDDADDNCAGVSNVDQADANEDGYGDACASADARIDGGVVHRGSWVAPRAWLQSGAETGLNAVIGRGATVGVNAVVGEDVIVGRIAQIGDGATVGPGSTVGYAASIGMDTTVGASVAVGALVSLGSDSQVGANTVLARGVQAGAGAELGDGVTVGPAVQLGLSALIGQDVRIRKSVLIGDDVTVGQRTRIGRDARILDGAIVGDDVTVGPGATIAAGVTVPSGTQIARATTFTGE